MKHSPSVLTAAFLTIFAVQAGSQAFAAASATDVSAHKKVTFPIAGFETVSQTPVSVTTDWDETLFGAQPSSVYNHTIARIAAIFSEVAYVGEQSGTGSSELTSCYHAAGFKDSSIFYHYDFDYKDPVWGNDQAGFSIASKQIESAAGKRTLVFVIIRGTPLNANEWLSNADLSNSTQKAAEYHEGFTRTAKQILESLDDYDTKHEVDTKSSYFLITGHSRGASVANVLAAALINNDRFEKENIYTYTFASPNVTTDKSASDTKYDGIWNIVNAEDIVPTVPLTSKKWQYRKYGRTVTIVNSWNCDRDTYDDEYLPRMNSYYTQFLLRSYSPFRTGSFIPVQVTRVLSAINKNVDSFYTGKFALHGRAEKIFWKVFPETPDPKAHGNSGLFGAIKAKIDDRTDGLAQYSLNAFVDMHSMEAYLSWMLALNENEIFSTVGSSEIILKGNYNSAVLDSKKNVVAKILDGQITYSSLKHPIAAVQLLPNLTVLGFPATEDFTVIIYKGSILPTSVSIRMEQYRSDGTLLSTTEKKYITPHKGHVYEIPAGKQTETTGIVTKQLWGKAAQRESVKYDLKEASFQRMQPEINIDTDANIGMGLHAGSQNFYMSILVSQNMTHMGKALEICPGIGTQQTLTGPILLNTECYTKFVQSLDDNNNESGIYNLVPSIRLLFTIKPMHRTQFFIAGLFDFCISGLNGDAFNTELRPENITPIHFSDSVEAYPSVQFGIKF